MVPIDFSKECLYTYAPFRAKSVLRDEIKNGLLTDKAIEKVALQPGVYTKPDVIDILYNQAIKKVIERFDNDEIIIQGCKKENQSTKQLMNHYQIMTLEIVEDQVNRRVEFVENLLAKKSPPFSESHFFLITAAKITAVIGILAVGLAGLRK